MRFLGAMGMDLEARASCGRMCRDTKVPWPGTWSIRYLIFFLTPRMEAPVYLLMYITRQDTWTVGSDTAVIGTQATR
jgi:hypothetical protein